MRTIWNPTEEALQKTNRHVYSGWLSPKVGAEARLWVERYYGQQKVEGERPSNGAQR